MAARGWEEVGRSDAPSWYLDPLVAAQKSLLHRELAGRWTAGLEVRSALKTDLFEEAFGNDYFFPDLLAGVALTGIDVSSSTAARAARRFVRLHAVVADVRRLGLADASFDLVISNSTLDHFETQEEFVASLREIVRVLRPGGRLILTLDNPHNPLYHALKLLCRLKMAPFPLGYTASMETSASLLGELGLRVREREWLIHNPRLISTAMFWMMRMILGRHADRMIGAALALFARLGQLPTRRFTGCFLAIYAEKPE